MLFWILGYLLAGFLVCVAADLSGAFGLLDDEDDRAILIAVWPWFLLIGIFWLLGKLSMWLAEKFKV